jgi:collagenase-like PrtC family protease
LIAPAGNMECARAAVANGADAVYFGLEKFNARMRAENFTEEQLPGLVRFLHEHGLRAFCTVNTLIFTDELAEAERELMLLDAAGVDVIIVQDLGLAVLARELGVKMDVHASTQMTITSPEGAKFAGRLGVKRIVLAREASMREIAKFGSGTAIPALEVFVHGALCVAYSGQCLTSEALGQRSANRGECARAAVANGADAVYFGLEKFNARMRAENFTEEQLPGLVRFLHEHGLRALCTVNTLIFTDELAEAERELMLLDEAGVDVIIVQDLGLAVLARELGVRMDVHASTQMTIKSPEARSSPGVWASSASCWHGKRRCGRSRSLATARRFQRWRFSSMAPCVWPIRVNA